MFKVVLQIFILSTIRFSNGAKILGVFSSPSMDSYSIYKTLIEELVERGHEITLVTVNAVFSKNRPHENITEINLHESSHAIWLKYRNVITSNQNIDLVSKIKLTLHAANNAFEKQLRTDVINELIQEKSSYFDLLLLEAGVMSLLSFSNIFKAPAILVGSNDAVEYYEAVGAPIHPLLYPSIFRRRLYNLTSWEKMSELYMHIRIGLTLRSIEKKCNVMLKKQFGLEFPSLNKLKNNVHALFLNTNPIWNDNRPIPSNVIFVGGIQPNITEYLPEDVKSFLDKSRHGVVYVSFGNNIHPSLLSPAKILTILNVLSIIPQDVLLKWDAKRLPGVPKNIKVFTSLPQKSVLSHPKIKLFITQGDFQSTFETISAGVPLIGIPILPDNWYHAEKYEHFHIGTQLGIAKLTEEKLINAINLVLSDGNYRRNIVHLRALMFDQPQSPLERAIWWTEYVIRHGGARHLRSPSANIAWPEYQLDLVLTLLFIFFVVITVLIAFSSMILRLIVKSYNDVRKKIS